MSPIFKRPCVLSNFYQQFQVPLVLFLAISYVQADLQGYGHHHGHHHYPHDRDASADPDDYETDAAYAPPTPNNPPSGYGPPPANPPEYA